MSDVAAIAQQLRDRIELVASQLLPAGVMVQRRYWRVGSLAGEPGQSLCVYLAGGRRGRWRDFGSGERGDALDLIAQTLCGGDTREAIKWAKGWLGIEEIDPMSAKSWPSAPRSAAPSVSARPNARPCTNARTLWRFGSPASRSRAATLPTDICWCRGIDLRRLGRVPRALRTHPGLRHPSGGTWPAMVAAVCDAEGRARCVTHRTWLRRAISLLKTARTSVKAPVGNAKMTLGSYVGGCIRLARGASGKPWSQMVKGEPLMVGEGIEDVLSAMLDWPQYRAICAVSLSSMLALDLPETVGDVLLLQQGDRPGSPARKLLRRVVEHFEAGGHTVYFWNRPVFIKDYNELKQHSAELGPILH